MRRKRPRQSNVNIIRVKTYQTAAVVIAALLYLGMRSMPFSKDVSAKGAYLYVTYAYDGDTLKLSNGQKVRLIGMDTPELHHSRKLLRDAGHGTARDIRAIQELGALAADFTKALCVGKKVRLEFDVAKKDRYGRLLAYVYLEDGTFVNAKILEEGYGQVMTVAPNVKYADYFLKLQREAREKSKGLWAVSNTP